MTLVEELRNKKSRDNRELLDRAAAEIEDLDRNLCAAYKKIEKLQKQMPPCKLGDTVWCLEKEDGEYCGVVGEMFLAVAGNVVITSAFIDSAVDVDEELKYYIRETQDHLGVEVSFYPLEDCFTSRSEAERALKERCGV